MYDCECLIHPFQNDPGTSQSQRVMDELLSGAAKIDARTLADLLDYFVQLSRHINYYDLQLNVSDWQPFFKKSIPFTLASVINYKPEQIESDFTFYNSLFEKKPSSTGLQLQAYFIFYHFINKINNWYLSVKDSGLPIERDIEILIKDKLQQPVKSFICYTNAAVKWYGIKRIDFLKLYESKVWNLDLNDLYCIDETFKKGTGSKYKRLNNLYQDFKNIYPPFFSAIKNLSVSAEKNLEQSLLPLKDELQKKHPPHLGLLFAFLNMFRHLQDDLNGYTRKHLDFFYKDVLQIKSREAVADRAHVLFEIQKQLEKYLIKKGILVKDGKDSNKQEILFSLDDEIVVNKTELADTRTLFLNNQIIPNPANNGTNVSLLEGIYMAPDAAKADGVDKDFTTDIKNFYTVGNKESKYLLPGTNIFKPYPNARLGFILASQVLYLKEGRRTINFTLACQLQDPASNDGDEFGPVCDSEDSPNFYSTKALFKKVAEAFRQYYVYISEDLIQQAIKKGISNNTINLLRDNFLAEGTKDVCGKTEKIYKQDEVVSWDDWWNKYYNVFYVVNADVSEKAVIDELFEKRRVFKILFSGEKAWVEPSQVKRLRFTALTEDPVTKKKTFAIKFKVVIKADKPAVTFFDKEKLKEDYDTTLPLVKIELDDLIKIKRGFDPPAVACCLSRMTDNTKLPISFYYFLRNVKVIEATDANVSGEIFETKIDVKVCGLKNFIVQNDESLQDVNAPVYPFGTRPDIADFDVANPNPAPKNLVGPNFYIGSQEVFCKKWNQVFININWKDKPTDFFDYYKAYTVNTITLKFGLDINEFQANISVLEDGKWISENSHALPNPPPLNTVLNAITNGNNRLLFKSDGDSFCIPQNNFEQIILIQNDFFGLLNPLFRLTSDKIIKFDVNSRNGFLKINLQNQDFCHKNYAFVLARQMMAFGKLPDQHVEGAIYYDSIPPLPGSPVIISTNALLTALNNSGPIATRVNLDVQDIDAIADGAAHNITLAESATIRGILRLPNTPNPGDLSLNVGASTLDNTINNDVITKLTNLKKFEAIIPNEPWTPTIKEISLDYTATAILEDIDLIHLYPYAGTYKHEEIELQPTLFPTFCDEGTLFLGLKELVPGNNLNILFQLAEATSDSESDKEEVHWHYLDNNVWRPLRKGFEVLDDATENLTASGIVKFAMPANMTKDNTVMPKDLHWIKASIAKNSKAVSETTGIHPQAILVIFTNDEANDKLRLSQPLSAQSISKLNEADANVKSVQQPYETYGGRIPEMEGQFYVRVSELLRHKGRAIQKFDYERLALEAFPQLFKAKCINHSFALDAHLYKNDFPYAGGYVILAVIPDLYKLKAGNSFEPKVPVSIIEKIDAYVRKRTSPFVRFRAMNPRYEKINFSLRVKLMPGKDENYFREKLKQDLKELLAPWAVGKYDKLTFGQCVYRSDIIRFLENTDYVDFINDFQMGKEAEIPKPEFSKICPDTPRSILIAGEIEVCIEPPECEQWQECYDDNQNKVECCTTPLIAVANYCEEKNETPG